MCVSARKKNHLDNSNGYPLGHFSYQDNLETVPYVFMLFTSQSLTTGLHFTLQCTQQTTL